MATTTFTDAYYDRYQYEAMRQNMRDYPIRLGGVIYTDDMYAKEIKVTSKKETKMDTVTKPFNWFSQYVEKHKDALFTLALLLLADQLIFKGKFRNKLEETFVNFTDSLNKKVKPDA